MFPALVWLWIGLFAVIATMLAAEFLLRRRVRGSDGLSSSLEPAGQSRAEAMTTALAWIAVSVGGFAFLIGHVYHNQWQFVNNLFDADLKNALPGSDPTSMLSGSEALIQFLTVYVTEVALTLDNIAILTLLFAFYKIPGELTSRVLFWGVLISLILRLVMTMAGGWLSLIWPPTVYVFAALLLISMVRTLLLPDEQTDLSRGIVPRTLRRILPTSKEFNGLRLTTRGKEQAKWAVTPLGFVVILAGIADFTYTADSIPAAFSITADPFIAFAGQALALLGLRSMYFAIAPVIKRFRYLKISVVFIMAYIAGKTLLFSRGQLATEITLAVVAVILATGVTMSVVRERRRAKREGALKGNTHASSSQLELDDDVRPAPIEDLLEAALVARRNFRKALILIAGTSVIIFAILIAPLPGPGPTVLIPVGVAILATEFVWAKTLFDRGKVIAEQVATRSDSVSRKIPKWVAIPALIAFYAFWVTLYFWGPESKAWKTFCMFSAGGGSFFMIAWAWRLLTRPAQGHRPVKFSSAARAEEKKD